MSLYSLSKYIIAIFLTLSVMNSISWIGSLHNIVVYSKIVIVFSIVVLYFFTTQYLQKMSNIKYLLIFFILIIGYSFLFYYDNNKTFFDTMFRSIMFALYLIFIYYLVQSIYSFHKFEDHNNCLDETITDIVNIFQKTLLPNIIVWTLVALVIGRNLYDIDITGMRSGFAGFTGDRQTFGLLMATLYLSTLLLYIRKKQKIHILILVISFLVIIYTDSRTSEIAVLIPTLYIYVKKKIKNLELYILPIILFSIYYMLNDITFDINEYSSGRILVWSLFLNEAENNNIFYGYGLFNFNNIILQKYIYMSYYFRRIDFLYFHSSYIEIFAAGGLLAVLFYLLFVVKTYFIANIPIKGIIIGVAVASAFESFIVSPIFPISLLFWMLLILTNIHQISKEENAKT